MNRRAIWFSMFKLWLSGSRSVSYVFWCFWCSFFLFIYTRVNYKKLIYSRTYFLLFHNPFVSCIIYAFFCVHVCLRHAWNHSNLCANFMSYQRSFFNTPSEHCQTSRNSLASDESVTEVRWTYTYVTTSYTAKYYQFLANESNTIQFQHIDFN